MTSDYIDTAFERTERERRWTEAEKQAFEAFARRVQNTTVKDAAADEPTRSDMEPPHLMMSPAPDASSAEIQTKRIREAYIETVMDTAVHRCKYDESLAESLESEFGSEIAAGVLRTGPVTSQLQTAILGAVERSQGQRTRVLKLFDDELVSLERAHELHQRIETALAELDEVSFEAWHPENVAAARDRLSGLENDCDALMCRRQGRLHSRPNLLGSSIEHENVIEYLYQTCAFTHPVLAATTEYMKALRDYRRHIERVLERVD